MYRDSDVSVPFLDDFDTEARILSLSEDKNDTEDPECLSPGSDSRK